jgi:hypothetical protein
MATSVGGGYDNSIGTKERSAVSATKVWAIVLALIGLVGVVMITMFLVQPFDGRSSGPISSENTATRPAEP